MWLVELFALPHNELEACRVRFDYRKVYRRLVENQKSVLTTLYTLGESVFSTAKGV